MPRIVRDGAVLAFSESGAGIPLLLIHAFPLDHSLWDFQIRGLSDAARVIAPDLRGFGASAPATEVTTMEDCAADLAALLDHLGVERAVLGGLSMGGYVALAFLSRYPERVAGLILANTRAGADTPEGRRGRHETAEKVLQEGVEPLAVAMVPKLLGERKLKDDPALVECVRRMILNQSPSAVAAALRGLAARPDRKGLLAGVRMPALVVTGALDILIPPGEGISMAAAIPGARLLQLEAAGHLSCLEEPQLFNAAVGDLLARVVAG